MYDPNDKPLATTKPEQNKFADLERLVEEWDSISSTDVESLRSKLYELTKLRESIEATESPDMLRSKETLRLRANNAIIRIIKKLRALASPAGLGLDDATAINFKENIYDVLNQWAYLAAIHPEVSAIISTVVGPILALSLLDRAASQIKTPLSGTRDTRRGGGGAGSDTSNIEGRMKLIDIDKEELRRWGQEQFAQMYKDGVLTYVPYGGDPDRPLSIDLKPYIDAGLLRKIMEDFPYAEILDYYNRELDEFLKNRDPHSGYGIDQTIPHTIDHEPLLKAIAARAATAAAKESYGYAQAATRDKLLADREYRENMEQRMRELLPALQGIRKALQDDLESELARLEAQREDALNKAEKTDPAQPKGKLPPDAPLVPVACPPRLDAEYIDPVSYWRDLRNSPQLKEPPKYRFAGPFTAMTPGAMAFMLAAESAAAGPAAGAPQGGARVIIERILPPPTHLADEDFRRCMQREIDKLIIDFDTGVRG